MVHQSTGETHHAVLPGAGLLTNRNRALLRVRVAASRYKKRREKGGRFSGLKGKQGNPLTHVCVCAHPTSLHDDKDHLNDDLRVVSAIYIFIYIYIYNGSCRHSDACANGG